MCTDKKEVMYSSVENPKYLLNRLFAFIAATNLDFYLQIVNKDETLK